MRECDEQLKEDDEDDLDSLSFRHPMRGNIEWMLEKLEEADPGGKKAWANAQRMWKKNNQS